LSAPLPARSIAEVGLRWVLFGVLVPDANSLAKAGNGGRRAGSILRLKHPCRGGRARRTGGGRRRVRRPKKERATPKSDERGCVNGNHDVSFVRGARGNRKLKKKVRCAPLCTVAKKGAHTGQKRVRTRDKKRVHTRDKNGCASAKKGAHTGEHSPSTSTRSPSTKRQVEPQNHEKLIMCACFRPPVKSGTNDGIPHACSRCTRFCLPIRGTISAIFASPLPLPYFDFPSSESGFALVC